MDMELVMNISGSASIKCFLQAPNVTLQVQQQEGSPMSFLSQKISLTIVINSFLLFNCYFLH